MEPAINTTIPAVREFAFGDRATINEIVDGPNSSAINYQDGFPHSFSNPNGKKVLIGDVNAMGKIATAEQWYCQCGGIHSYNKEFSEKIGGYPNGIVLDYFSPSQQKLRRVMSLVDNNTWNFNANDSDGDERWIDGIHWAYCDKYDYSVKAFSIESLTSYYIEYNASKTQYVEFFKDVEVNIYIDIIQAVGTASSQSINEWGVYIQAPAGSRYNTGATSYNKVLVRFNGGNFVTSGDHAHYWLKSGTRIFPYIHTGGMTTSKMRICVEGAVTGYATDDAS